MEGSVQDLVIEDGRCRGVKLKEGTLNSETVVLTTGTFLGGQCFIGHEMMPAGRFMRQD